MQSVWTVGDLCLHGTDYSQFGLIEKLHPDGKLSVSSDTARTGQSLRPDELKTITRDTVRHVSADELDLLARVDGSYFSQKLDKLCGIFSGKLKTSVPMVDPVIGLSGSVEWTPGKLCICTWTEDENYYYATILKSDEAKDYYLVRFCHYDNEEVKTAADLHPLGSDFELLVEDDCNRAAAKLLQRRLGSRQNVNAIPSTRPAKPVDKLPPSMKTNRVPERGQKAPDDVATPLLDTVDSPMPTHSNAHRSNPSHHRIPFPTLPTPPRTLTPNLANLQSLRATTSINPQAEQQAPWQALLISWFMCGYHTGYFEALTSDSDRGN